jgi:hypothetical protein
LALSAESKDADYRQEMTNNRVDTLVQANDLNRQIKKIERRISAASNRSNTTFTEASKKEYTDLLKGTWTDLTKSIEAVTRIQLAAQKDFIGVSGVLYTVTKQVQAYNPNKKPYTLVALISLIAFMAIGVMITAFQLYLKNTAGDKTK